MAEFPAPEACNACGTAEFESDQIIGRDLMMGQPGEFAVFLCARCGSGTTSPFVANEDLGRLYEGVYAPFAEYQFPRGLGWALKLIRKGMDAYFHRFTLASEVRNQRGRLLEVGCGMGRFGGTFVDRGWDVYGVEPSPLAAESASARGMKMHVGTLATFQAPEQPFDVVLFRHSLEHVVFPREELKMVSALLAPGGKLLVEVPNFGSWQARRYREDWFNLSLPMHRTHFTSDGLRSAAEDAGFSVNKIAFSTGAVSIPASEEHRRLGRWLHRSQISMMLLAVVSLAVLPITMTIDRLRGGGDILRMVAVRGED